MKPTEAHPRFASQSVVIAALEYSTKEWCAWLACRFRVCMPERRLRQYAVRPPAPPHPIREDADPPSRFALRRSPARPVREGGPPSQRWLVGSQSDPTSAEADDADIDLDTQELVESGPEELLGYGYGEWTSGPFRTQRPRRSVEHAPFAGRGPRGYQPSDVRIYEEVCDRLTFDSLVDAVRH
jgi:hypothetical protein